MDSSAAPVALLDTTVASFLHPKKAESNDRLLYAPHMVGKTLALSFQTVAELFCWAERNHWGARQKLGLEEFLRSFLVLDSDIELSKVWAEVMEASRREGRRLESGDGWIAASAVHYGIPLLTHDADFLGRSIPGLVVISHLHVGHPESST